MKPWTRRENLATAWLPTTIAFLAGALSTNATEDWQVFALGFALAATIALTYFHFEARRKHAEAKP